MDHKSLIFDLERQQLPPIEAVFLID